MPKKCQSNISLTLARLCLTSMKRTVLAQELLRVMLRCSPLLEWSRVTEHLNGMMRRLQFSGYDQRFRAQVLKAAFTAYDNIRQEDADGVRPMYRPKDWDRKGREEKKMKKRERAGSEKEGQKQ